MAKFGTKLKNTIKTKDWRCLMCSKFKFERVLGVGNQLDDTRYM